MWTRTGDRSVRVLFVGGHGRSGSTLVARTLGSVEGASCVGELRYLWDRLSRPGCLCGCGEPFRSCDFWERVGKEAYGGWDRVDVTELARLHASVLRLRHLPAYLVPLGPFGRTAWRYGRIGRFGVARERLAEATARVYRALAAVTGGDVIVDSSKYATSALLLSGIEGIDLRVVQLVREPHGVVHSWARGRSGAGVRMARHAPAQAALEWVAFNGLTEALRLSGTPWTLLRYEDFVRAPELAARRALALVGLGGFALPRVGAGVVDLPVDHLVAGNPNRVASGPIRLLGDEEWRRSMGVGRRRLVTALTAPGMLRYGYPLRCAAPTDLAAASDN